ncbi:Biotin/lipoyl attachment domain protein [mine drainage metagenome]|uniref:Biotin/lipoyl attachment domain protein n=1 Tax=mine drainage metagenome TaxID=410659 RepID=T1C2Z7_9ZZZZ
MVFEFKLPDIGEGVNEGEIVKWHVKEGDILQKEQEMVEIMTDKVTVNIPSPIEGMVLKIL